MNKRIRKKRAGQPFFGKFDEPMLCDLKGNSVPLADVKFANGVIVGDPFGAEYAGDEYRESIINAVAKRMKDKE